MNREKITAILALLVAALCGASLFTTVHVCRRMSALTEEAIASSYVMLYEPDGKNDLEALLAKSDSIREVWEAYEPIVSTYSRHNEVERVSKAVQKLRPLLECKRTDEVYATLHEIHDALEHLKKTELPSAANIL